MNSTRTMFVFHEDDVVLSNFRIRATLAQHFARCLARSRVPPPLGFMAPPPASRRAAAWDAASNHADGSVHRDCVHVAQDGTGRAHQRAGDDQGEIACPA